MFSPAGSTPIDNIHSTDPAGGESRDNRGETPDFSEDTGQRRVARQPPWRVFLSHTSELRHFPAPGQSYVDRAERAVSAAGHAIVDMADFAAADQKPASLCEDEVSRGDVYVGIFGLRYGSPVRDRPEISYTELEFETATKKGLPRLIFLVDSDSADLGLPPKAMIDREFGERQDAFLQRVRECGLIVQSFRSLDHLQLLVERSLRNLRERSVSANALQPPAGRPDWRWPTPWDFRGYRKEKREGFVGRAWLFEEVRAWATDPDPNAPQALLIGADYGVGKSAFLAELIERNCAGLPIAAQHFCTAEQVATLTPGLFVRNLAAQLAEAFPAFRQALEADEASERRRWLDEADQDPQRALDQALLAPLLAIEPTPAPRLLVVDALDEAQDPRTSAGPEGQISIVMLIARYATRLPSWLKLLATSRRRPDVLNCLSKDFSLKDLDAEEDRNLICLRTYALARCQESPLADHLRSANLTACRVADVLCAKRQSCGKFLYVAKVLDDLTSGLLPLLSPADLEALPPGLDGFYRDTFERRFPTEESYVLIRDILGVLCEQNQPLGRHELAAIMSRPERYITEQLRPVHDLLRLQPVTIKRQGVVTRELLHSFDHHALPQWLSEENEWLQPRAGRFTVDRVAAAERIRAWMKVEAAADRNPAGS